MKSVGVLCITVVSFLSIGQATAVSEAKMQPESIPTELCLLEHLKDLPHIEFDHYPGRYDSAGLDSFIRATMANAHIPGAATWTSKNGQVIWQQCYGYANLEDSIEVADTTIFMLASISKTFVGTAIMQLWERGEFELDDDINDYLPFNVHSPVYPDSTITFRMLMTHTSSIHDNWSILSPLWNPGDPTIPLGEFLYEYLVPGGIYYSTANFNVSPPGVYYDYCNTAFALLGYLVEEMADSFPIYCQDSIFEPLGMNHTSWFLAGLDTSNIAVRYQWTGTYYQPYPHIGHPFYPAAQLRANMLDLAQHLTAIMQYGVIDTVRILDSTTVGLMLSSHFVVSSDFIMGLTWRYEDAGRWIWGHSGYMTGVRTYYGFCPAESSGVIVLTNGGVWETGTVPIILALFDYAQQYGIEEQPATTPVAQHEKITATIFYGSLRLPRGQKCRVFDITGRVVEPTKIQPGIYFIEVDGVVTQKVVKVR